VVGIAQRLYTFFFSTICQDNLGFLKIWQEKWVLYMNTNIYFWHVAQFFLEWEIFQDKSFGENQNTFYVQQCFLKKLCPYVITWKNTVEADKPQMTIWCTCIAWLICRATNTLRICLISCPLQQQLHKHAPMLCYTLILSLVKKWDPYAWVKNEIHTNLCYWLWLLPSKHELA